MSNPFALELATLAGVSRGQLTWRTLSLERAVNGPMTVSATVDNDTAGAAEIQIGSRSLRLFDGTALRFNGKLREPLARTPGAIAITGGSPASLLDRRQLQLAKTFASVDQGAIVDQLLAAENIRSPTRMRMGPYDATVRRDRIYEAGKSLRAILDDLSAADEGFYWIETPINEDGLYSQLEIRWPLPGTDRPGVRFEYGTGTLGNLSDYSVQERMPLNASTVSGSNETADAQYAAPIRRASDIASIAAYDLLEEWISDSDVTIPAVLAERAARRLRPDPTFSIQGTLVATGEATNEPPIPRLFDDYDVGDTVYVSVRDETTQLYNVPVVIGKATLTVSSDDDSETTVLEMTTVVGQEPGDIFYRVLEDYERRIRGVETALRRSGTGGLGEPPVDLTLAEFLVLVPTDLMSVTITDLYDWTFQYQADEPSANKWVFVSGSPLAVTVPDLWYTGNHGYTIGVPAGPSITVPLSGSYTTLISTSNPASSGSTRGRIGAHDGGVFFLAADQPSGSAGSYSNSGTHAFDRSDIFDLRYLESFGDGAAGFSNRTISISPVRVSQA